MKQVSLSNGKTKTVVWIDYPRIKKGNRITLKGDDKFWDVLDIYEPVIDSQDIKRNWHVGGL